MSYEHGHYITKTRKIKNPYTSALEEETEEVWNILGCCTIKSDKCYKHGYIFR